MEPTKKEKWFWYTCIIVPAILLYVISIIAQYDPTIPLPELYQLSGYVIIGLILAGFALPVSYVVWVIATLLRRVNLLPCRVPRLRWIWLVMWVGFMVMPFLNVFLNNWGEHVFPNF